MRAVLLSLFCLTSAVSAQETYTIKVFIPKKGTVEVVKSEEESIDKLEIFDPQGNTLEKKNAKRTFRTEYQTEFLAPLDADQRVTRAKRTYSLDEKSEDGIVKKTGLHGRTVLIEQEDAGYSFLYDDGKRLDDEDAKKLKNSFRTADSHIRDDEVLPKKPVKINETWQVEPGVLNKLFKGIFEVDETRSQMDGKLLNVTMKDGKLYGKLSFTIDLRLKSFQGLRPTKESFIKLNVREDRVIDGSSNDGSEIIESEIFLDTTADNGARIVLTEKGKETRTTRIVRD